MIKNNVKDEKKYMFFVENLENINNRIHQPIAKQ